jgi:spermidine synthase
VELDPLVVEACQQHLFDLGTAWQDPRLQLAFGDGFDFAQHAAPDSFDVILVDGCDPEGPAARLVSPLFFAACRRILRKDGVLGIQSGSPFLTPQTYAGIRDTLFQSFDRVHPYFGPAPLYAAGPWSYMHCSHSIDPLAVDPQRAARISQKTRYWSPPVHRGAFAVPPFAAR